MIRISPTHYVRQCNQSRRPLVFWLVLAAGTITVCGLIVVAPLALAGNQQLFAAAIYQSFARVCHQLPERSFYLAGFPLAVCSRCAGLYFGFTAVMLLYPLLGSLKRTSAPPRKWLLLSATPMALDVGLYFLGVWLNTHSSRFLTGALLSGVSVFYIMPGVVDLSLRGGRATSQRNAGPLQPTTTTSARALATAPSDYSTPGRRI